MGGELNKVGTPPVRKRPDRSQPHPAHHYLAWFCLNHRQNHKIQV